MVRPPTPAEEDERRLTRERQALVIERTRLVNRINGLLTTQGVFGVEPMRTSCRKQLEQLRGWNGHALPPRLKAELTRELNRLELVISQVATVEDERDRALKAKQHRTPSICVSRWFRERVGDRRGKIRRITIVAVARKLLIALWRYVTIGLVPEGAELKP
jgi:transposase